MENKGIYLRPITSNSGSTKRISFLTLLLVVATSFLTSFQLSSAQHPKNSDQTQSTDSSRPNLSEPVPIVEVIDGDTIRVFWRGKLRLVRLIGTDAPESVENPRASRQASTHSEDIKKVIEFGKRSTKQLKTLIGSAQKVRLEFDEQTTDQYGRLLAYAYVNDVMLNREMLRTGFTEFYFVPPNGRYRAEFREVYTLAKKTKRGLWSFGGYEYAPPYKSKGKGIPRPNF